MGVEGQIPGTGSLVALASKSAVQYNTEGHLAVGPKDQVTGLMAFGGSHVASGGGATGFVWFFL